MSIFQRESWSKTFSILALVAYNSKTYSFLENDEHVTIKLSTKY